MKKDWNDTIWALGRGGDSGYEGSSILEQFYSNGNKSIDDAISYAKGMDGYQNRPSYCFEKVLYRLKTILYNRIQAKQTPTKRSHTMKFYKNEIEVAERNDMTYYVSTYGDKFIPRVNFRPEGRRWESFKVGNEKGYKTMRGAMNAIKRDAGLKRWDAPNGYTLIGC